MLISPQNLMTELLAEVEAFMAGNSMTAKAFGMQAVSDPNFVRRLRAGANMQIRTIDRAYEYLRSQQRSDAAQ